MTTEAAHQARLQQLFHEEAAEHFDAIRRELASVHGGAEERVRSLRTALRAAHSVKGGATICGLLRLGSMMHNWESCASAVVNGHVAPDDATLELLLRAIDAANDELDVRTGVELEAPGDPARIAAELSSRFAESCELRPIEAVTEATPESNDAPARDGTVRVATRKVDQQMARVEELLRLKVGDEDRLGAFSRSIDSLEKLRAALSETRRLARAVVAPGAGKVCESLDVLVGASDEAFARITTVFSETRKATHALSALATSLHADVRAVRLLPVETALASFSRMVRELARATGKRVRFELHGGDVEVDRDVLEAIKDPVMHLLRNAVDHGIEVPEERELFGKPAEALVRVEARSGAGMLELEIRDDGRGVLADRVLSAAQDRGIASSEQLAKMDEEQLKALIFHEGFSTSKVVTEVSGRGVGLAVVRTQIERIGGRVEFSSIDGEGAGFRLMLPLNLATARFVLVEASRELFAVPALSVERVVRVRVEDLVRVDHGTAFELGGKPVPISRLSDAVDLPPSDKPSGRLLALVLGSSSERAAFVVDRIADEREFVARNLGDHLRPVGVVNGVAVLPDGALAPILNAAELLRRALAAATSASFEQRHKEGSLAARRVLVVDDSVTTRTLEKSILEAAGYQVSVAVDGMEALERLGRSQFDLVLSDVQMPRMDGLTLVRAMKQDARLRGLPVVLVSSLDAADQRRQGLDAGADAYLSKGEFEQGLLLSTLGRFL